MTGKNLIWISMLLCIFFVNSIDATYTNYITLENKFNARMEITDIYVVDLDNDGLKEVIATSYDSKVYLLDSNVDLMWQFDAKAYVYSANAIDIEKDGKSEIVAGSSRIQVLDLNRTVVVKFPKSDPVKRMVVGDFDNDGYEDIMASTGSVRKHTTYIFNNKFETLWQESIRGEFPWGIAMEDINGDGKKEVIIGGSEVLVYDAEKNMLWSFKPAGAVFDLKVEDVDNDGKKEVLVGSYPNLYVLTNDGNVKWEYKTRGMIKSVHITDLENDGKKDIIIGSDKVYLFNDEGDLIWDFNTTDDVNYVHSGDLDWDGMEEIAVGSKIIYVLKKDGSLQWEYEPYRAAAKLLITDLDNDGRNDLVVGAFDHNVYLFKAREIYVKEMQSYSLYEEAEEFYDKGMYSEAKVKIDEAIGIKNICDVGKCKEEPDKCDSLLQRIEEKLPATTTTSTVPVTQTTTTMEEITTTTISGGADAGFTAIAVILLVLVVVAGGLYRINKR
jgi:hypothetical protein